MDVARRYDAKLYVVGETLQLSRDCQIATYPVALQLDKESLVAEHRLAMLGELASGAESFRRERPWQQAVPAPAGEDDQPVMACFDRREWQSRA